MGCSTDRKASYQSHMAVPPGTAVSEFIPPNWAVAVQIYPGSGRQARVVRELHDRIADARVLQSWPQISSMAAVPLGHVVAVGAHDELVPVVMPVLVLLARAVLVLGRCSVMTAPVVADIRGRLTAPSVAGTKIVQAEGLWDGVGGA
jgi:hypothetical protein